MTASGDPSKPDTMTSSGTLSPNSFNARMALPAMTSLAATTASNRLPLLSKLHIAL